jgi:hypothetical protein
MTKYCPSCQRTLPRTAFGRHRGRWDDCQPWCKACTRIAGRQHYARVKGERYVEPRRQVWPPRPREETR